ncbi:MAG: DUF4349 domain-containing protein [Anaerolineales bacterium]
MKRSLVLIGIVAITILSACASAAATQAPAATVGPVMPERQSLAPGAPPAPQESYSPFSDTTKSAAGSAAGPAVDNSAAAPTNRLVIQNADLSIVVPDVNARVNEIQTMAKAMGGFIVSVNVAQTYTSNGDKVPQAQIVVRVPQDKIDDALAQIKKNTVDVQNETRSGNDVTDQYVDLQSRLTAKQAAEQQLLKIMQNATKTQDVLDVYAQLQQVQSDIEVLKGQIKFYEQSAAMSAISVNVIAEETVKPIKIGGWEPRGVANDAIQQLIYFWQAFINFLIRFFLYILPVLITIGIPLYILFLILRWLLRRTRRPRAVVPVEEPRK